VLLFFVALLAVGLFAFKDYGISWDEPDRLSNGINALYSAVTFRPQPAPEGEFDWAYGPAFNIVLSVAATRDAFIESRVLFPVYVPVTLILMKFVNGLIGASRAVPKATVNKVPVVLVGLWLCLPLVSVVRSTFGRFEDGAGSFSRKRWRESETVSYVKQMLSTRDDVLVYSNGTDALWELARVNAGQLPLRTEVSLDELKGRWPAGSGSVLVWFNTLGWREHLYSVKELQRVADFVEVACFSDGYVYRISVRDIAASTSR
jgi:hypothetical protein